MNLPGLLIPPNVPRANAAVLEVMLGGGWWTLKEISERTGLSENTVSTRISENGRPKSRGGFGFPYLKRRKVAHVREYRLDFAAF